MNIVLDKTKFGQKKDIFELRTEEVEVPELNPVMGFSSIGELRAKKVKLALLKKEKGGKKEIENLTKEIDDFQIVTIKVSQINLSAYTKIRSEINDYAQNLIDGILAAAAKSDEHVEDETISALRDLKNLNQQARYQLLFLKYGIVEPKMNWSDLIWLSKVFPAVVVRISDKIMEMTNKGGALKKSSKTT